MKNNRRSGKHIIILISKVHFRKILFSVVVEHLKSDFGRFWCKYVLQIVSWSACAPSPLQIQFKTFIVSFYHDEVGKNGHHVMPTST